MSIHMFPTTPLLMSFSVAYIAIEAIFFLVALYHLLPRANQIRGPATSMDFGSDRHLLMEQVLKRCVRQSERDGLSPKVHFFKFLSGWIVRNGADDLVSASASSSVSSDAGSDIGESVHVEKSSFSFVDEAFGLDGMPKQTIDDFLAWGMLGKTLDSLEPSDHHEIQKMYEILKEEIDLTFHPTPDPNELKKYHMYRAPHGEMDVIHRPLAVYIVLALIKAAAGVFLFFQGYRRYVSESTGFAAWYRSGEGRGKASEMMPMVLFHGIAPGGIAFYLPMFLGGLAAERERSVFIFENDFISGMLNWSLSPLTDRQITDSVVEIVERVGHGKTGLHLFGHSYGSATATWVLKSKRLNVCQITMIDPVALLASDSDMTVGFVYAPSYSITGILASSEIFTQHYIRRYFDWGNSELFLDRMRGVDGVAGEHPTCRLLVCLSENDQIVNAANVKAEVESFMCDSTELILWEGASHGDCVTSVSKWKQMKQAMLRQELDILRDKCPQQH